MILRSTFLLVCMAAISAPISAQADHAELQALLRPGSLTVELLAPWSPPRLVVLTTQVQRAAAADPAWFRAAMASAAPGRPMAYDARLGVSAAEYSELLALTDSVTVRPSGAGTVTIESTHSGWRFGAATTLPALRGMEIDTIASVVRTSFGDLNVGPPISPSAAQRATGAWGASRWTLTTVNAESTSGVSATLAVGRFTETQRGIIYLQVRKLKGGAIVERADVLARVAP